jgi:hypothetical protein
MLDLGRMETLMAASGSDERRIDLADRMRGESIFVTVDFLFAKNQSDL